LHQIIHVIPNNRPEAIVLLVKPDVQITKELLAITTRISFFPINVSRTITSAPDIYNKLKIECYSIYVTFKGEFFNNDLNLILFLTKLKVKRKNILKIYIHPSSDDISGFGFISVASKMLRDELIEKSNLNSEKK